MDWCVSGKCSLLSVGQLLTLLLYRLFQLSHSGYAQLSSNILHSEELEYSQVQHSFINDYNSLNPVTRVLNHKLIDSTVDTHKLLTSNPYLRKRTRDLKNSCILIRDIEGINSSQTHSLTQSLILHKVIT